MTAKSFLGNTRIIAALIAAVLLAPTEASAENVTNTEDIGWAELPLAAIPPPNASLFRFVSTIPDDGTDVAGGWQEASAMLVFIDTRQPVPATWTCFVTIGMPIRAAAYGHISPVKAANYTANVATAASVILMYSQPRWVPAAYCAKYGPAMKKEFDRQFPRLGATVTSRG